MNWISNTLLRAILFAYDTASNFETVEPQTHALVLDWLKRRIDQYHYQRKQNDPASNHAVAMMMPAAIFGAMVGDRSMMEPAFKVWQRVLSSMREDGSLPREARRGARWFHYGSMQIGQLLTISQLAKSQDIELVAEQPSKSIPDAANFLVTALGDFSLANKYAKANEAGGETNDDSIPFVRKFHFGFVPAYQAMFGDDATIETMRTGPVDAELCALSARQDQKFKGCRTVPATLRDAFRSIGYEPDQNMGYPAGCFVGLTQFPLGD